MMMIDGGIQQTVEEECHIALLVAPWEVTMAMMTVQFTIGEYSKWRKGFDAGKPMRASAGISNERVFRNADNPNEVIIVGDASDVQKAQQMMSSPELKARMQESGVVGAPKVHVMA